MVWVGLLIIVVAAWAIFRMTPSSPRRPIATASNETSLTPSSEEQARSSLGSAVIPFILKALLALVVLVLAFQIRTCSDKADTAAAKQRAEQAQQAIASRKASIDAAIAAQKVLIGMSADEVRRSWGAPSKVNRTINAAGTSEQWIYSLGAYGNAAYVYLNNGVVTTIQAPQ